MKIIYMPNEINNDQLQGLTHSHLKTNLINLEFGRGCESDVYYYMMYMVKRGSKNGCAMEVERGLLDWLPRGPIVISSWSLVDLTTPCVMFVHAKFVRWSFTNIDIQYSMSHLYLAMGGRCGRSKCFLGCPSANSNAPMPLASSYIHHLMLRAGNM